MNRPAECPERAEAGPARGRVRRLLTGRPARYLAALAVLLFLWYGGRLRPGEFFRSGFDPGWAALALLLFLPNYLAAAVRYRAVLGALRAPCTLRQSVRWTMLAALGDLLLPFGVGADVVRAASVRRTCDPATAVASVVADRVAGLAGVVLLGGLAALLGAAAVAADPRLRSLAASAALLALALVAGYVGLLALRRPAAGLGRALARRLPGGALLARFAQLLWLLGRSPARAAAVLSLALLGHLAWCVSALCLAYALGLDVPLVPALVVLPVVVLCNTFSFAGGIGGGTLAFEYLFHHALGAAPGDGCRLGLVLPMVVTASRLFGLPWLLGARPPRGEAGWAAPAPARRAAA